MKRLFFAIALLAMVTACDNSRSYYCQSNENRSYYDAEGEFDTLAYSLGMNLGLGISLQYAEAGFDTDALIESFAAHVNQSIIDREAWAEHVAFMERFNSERVRPFMNAKRMNQMLQMQNAEPLPAIFDEEFTVERSSAALGRDMAEYVRKSMAEANTYWIIEAMKDAKQVSSIEEVDAKMRLTTAQMGECINNYFIETLPAEEEARSAEWLAEVAQRSDVHPLTVGKDTLYYRINSKGGSLHANNSDDEISFRFELYTRRGVLVESTADRANTLRKQIEAVRKDEMLSDSLRQVRIEKIEAQIPATEQPTIPMSQFMLEGAKRAIPLIGECGNITVWMPASLAYGKRGNRMVHPNEAVVMNFTLCDVTPAAEEPAKGDEAKKLLPKQGDVVKHKQGGKPTVVVKPVKE